MMRAKPFVLLLVVAVVALVAVDVMLVTRNRSLQQQVNALNELVANAARAGLVEGEPLPALSLVDAAGAPHQLDPVPTLLLVSAASCDVCDEVRPLWNDAARAADGSALRVLELVLDATPDSLGAPDRPHPVLAPGDDAWSLTSRIPGVPAAILIDETGAVRRTFYGGEHAGLRDAIERFLEP